MESFDTGSLFNVIRLSSAQRVLIYEHVKALAEDSGDIQLAAKVSRALAYEQEVRALETRWEASIGASASAYVPELRPLDMQLDRTLTSVRDVVRAQLSGESDDQSAAMAAELLDGIYPAGVAAVTRLPYIDQAAAAEDIVHALKTRFAAHVEHFGLSRKLTALAALVAEYSDAVRRSPASIEHAAVKAAQVQAHQHLIDVVARVVGTYFDSENPAHVAIRTRFLARLAEQMEATRTRTQARRRRAQAGSDDAEAGDAPT